MTEELLANFFVPVTLAAYDAGLAIMEFYDGELEIELKADQSPLTAADRAAHDLIQQRLQQLWSFPVLSEESSDLSWERRQDWQTFWLVDPLDGTKEFIRRNGEFTVNIALIHDGAPVLGVVYCPAKQVFYMGGDGHQARKFSFGDDFHDRDSLAEALLHADGDTLLPGPRPPGALRVIASRSHNSQETEDFIVALEEVYGLAERVASGSSLKMCLVAEGVADVYPRLAPTMEWDTAAGQAVVEAAGAQVIDFHTQQPLRYHKPNLTNPFFVTYAATWPPNLDDH